MTGAEASFGTPAEERRRSGRRRHQRRRRRARQEAQARDRRRRLRSQAGARGRREVRRRRSCRSSPGTIARRRRSRRRKPMPRAASLQITPGLDQSDVHRAQALEHVPRLRPRRPAGRGRRRLHRARTTRARTSPSFTTRRPTAKVSPTRRRRRSTRPASRRRSTRAYTKGDKDFNALVSKMKRGRHRRRLCRRLPHRSRPDPAPDARPGHEEPADGGRRARRQGVLRRSPARPAKA